MICRLVAVLINGVDADTGAARVDVGVDPNESGSRTVMARSVAGNIAVRLR